MSTDSLKDKQIQLHRNMRFNKSSSHQYNMLIETNYDSVMNSPIFYKFSNTASVTCHHFTKNRMLLNHSASMQLQKLFASARCVIQGITISYIFITPKQSKKGFPATIWNGGVKVCSVLMSWTFCPKFWKVCIKTIQYYQKNTIPMMTHSGSSIMLWASLASSAGFGTKLEDVGGVILWTVPNSSCM